MHLLWLSQEGRAQGKDLISQVFRWICFRGVLLSCDLTLSKICTWYHPVNLIKKISLGEDTCSEQLAGKVILKILKGGGVKTQVVLRNPAHQNSWEIQPTPSAPHHQANISTSILLRISDFPHCNKSNLRKRVTHSSRVWPTWAGKSGQQKLGAMIPLQPQSEVERWMMRPTFSFLFILPRYPTLYSKTEITPMCIFWRWWISHENHDLSYIIWLLNSLFQAVMLSWGSLLEFLEGLDSLDVLRSSKPGS